MKLANIILICAVFISCTNIEPKSEQLETGKTDSKIPELNTEAASNFANIALNCVHKEYPNKLSHVMNNESEVLNPKTLHPAFYGCFDWHSSVHGHWMLVRILKLYPELQEAPAIRKAMDKNLSAVNIQAEVLYLDQAGRKSFERTYGWSWLLKLTEELYNWNDPQGKKWLENLQPLADIIEKRYTEFLPKQDFPIRRGVHPNTAFGLSFALDYARIAGKSDFEQLIVQRAKDYFEKDKEGAARWEPDGDDFLSPSLMEADMMSRVLDIEQFIKWFDAFLPDLANGMPENLINPIPVSDRSDPKIVHLDGLNLSRAWCMFRISSVLPESHLAKSVLYDSAIRHAQATLPHISTGNYEGEHWLASFAVYMLSCKGNG
ncbi:MAG: DUF2891 domain-containing protein [Bacteroidota bacterium]|nr:DUF2891 domain-containing protein [Bacteroidota bacterium]